MTDLLRRTALLIAIALSASACSLLGSADPTTAPTSPAGAVLPDLKIAFVEDLSRDGADQRVAPAFQGARLAVDAEVMHGLLLADVHLVPLDTGGTSSGIELVATEIAEDPSFVAAIVAPQLSGQVSLGEGLADADVPTISLSSLGPDLPEPGWTAWRRAVPDVDREARALAAAVEELGDARRTCLVADGSPASVALIHAVADALEVRPALRLGLPDTDPDDPTVVSAIRDAGCGSVLWGGTPTGGGLLRLALVANGMRSVRLFGGESLKDAGFVATAGPRGRGTVAVCPCVDLSTSTDLRAQRFIQDYQSEFASPPGPFAAEAWDVARMLLAAVEAGARTRAQVAQALGATPTFDGLARQYAFGDDGDLKDQAKSVYVYRDEGVRWVAIPTAGSA